jgi:hypothetical protein
MADRKITELNALTTPNQKDLLYVVDDPSGTPVSKRISLYNLFGSVPANTSISGTLTVSANSTINGANSVVSANLNITSTNGPKVDAGYVTLASKTTVGSNNATTVLGQGGLQGSIFWDENYLYVATANNQIKRVALSVF